MWSRHLRSRSAALVAQRPVLHSWCANALRLAAAQDQLSLSWTTGSRSLHSFYYMCAPCSSKEAQENFAGANLL